MDMDDLYALGIFPTLTLTSVDVAQLSEDEIRELRDDFGATEELLVAVRELARVPGRTLRLHFDSQSVAISSSGRQDS